MQEGLQGTSLAVQRWRRSHPGDSLTGLPLGLQRRIARLLRGHTWAEVCRAVGVHNGVLARWSKEYPVARGRQSGRKSAQSSSAATRSVAVRQEKTKPPPQFIELPPSRPAPPSLKVEIRLPCGTVVIAHSDTSPTAVNALVSAIISARSVP